MNSTSLRAAVGALVLVAAAGCASDRSAQDPAAAPADAGTTAADSASDVTFGDLPSPCGEGEPTGATDQGVTADEVAIGFGDDRGFVSAPGLNQEIGDTVKAMIDWCNEQGGINGRQIVGHRYDAALTNAAAEVQKACKQDFMLVGQGFAYDEAAEPIRVGCDLPTVAAFRIGPNAAMGPSSFEPLPFPIDRMNTTPLALSVEEFPAFAEGPAMVASDSVAITSANAKTRAALAEHGVEPADCGLKISQNGEASYAPFAQRFKSCDTASLYTANGPIPSQFGLLEAITRSGGKPQYVMETQWYADATEQWNKATGIADGMVTGLMFQPFENADLVPATQQFLDIVEGAGAKPASLGVQGASAFLLWATAADECGAELTRECVVENLQGIHEWTGGGLHGATDPGANLPTSCGLLMQLEGDTWTQIAPAERGEFVCDEENIIEIDPALSGVTLDEDRTSATFQKN